MGYAAPMSDVPELFPLVYDELRRLAAARECLQLTFIFGKR